MAILSAFWRFLVGVKDALVLLFLALFFVGLWAALSARAPLTVPSGAALVLNLNGAIVDQEQERSPLAALGDNTNAAREYAVRDLTRAVVKARDDSRIKAIVLELDTFTGGGQANLSTLGSALDAFKKSGKPVYAYATAYTDDSYLLAAHATEIWANPLGGVFLTGPGQQGLYFADALQKLGITVNVFRVGTFKAAVEPFTRSSSSPEAKLAEQALVDTLWGGWKAEVRAVRPEADVEGFIATLPQRIAAAGDDLGRASLQAGLVDRSGAYSDLGDALAKRYGEADDDRAGGFNSIDIEKYLQVIGDGEGGSGSAVGIVEVSGTITDGEAGPGSAGGDTIARLIEKALADDAIKALVLRVDSPGGSVLASERIRAALLLAKARGLPIVASMGPVAASGGYWISTAADVIYAQPSTITGSIGVFAIIPTFEGALGKLAIGTDGVRSTPYSNSPEVLTGLTPQTRAILQSSVQDIYRRFTGLVAQSRRLTPGRVDAIGQGRVWAGSTALQLRLVDKLGGLDAAVAEARRRAKLKVDARVISIRPKSRFGLKWLEQLSRREDDTQETGRDLVGTLAARATGRTLAVTTRALGTLARPSVQAVCTECWAFGTPVAATDAKADALAAAIARSALAR